MEIKWFNAKIYVLCSLVSFVIENTFPELCEQRFEHIWLNVFPNMSKLLMNTFSLNFSLLSIQALLPTYSFTNFNPFTRQLENFRLAKQHKKIVNFVNDICWTFQLSWKIEKCSVGGSWANMFTSQQKLEIFIKEMKQSAPLWKCLIFFLSDWLDVWYFI